MLKETMAKYLNQLREKNVLILILMEYAQRGNTDFCHPSEGYTS